MKSISTFQVLKKIRNVSEDEAKTVASAIAHIDDVATKSDINELRAETKALRAETKAIRAEIDELRTETKALRGEMKTLRADTKADMAELRLSLVKWNALFISIGVAVIKIF